MLRRTVINRNLDPDHKVSSSSYRSTLYRKFSKYFEYLLNPENFAVEELEFNRNYVKNPAVEDRLERFKNSSQSRIVALCGSKGIGKSTYIRKTFGTTANPHVYENENLIIPFLLEAYEIEAIKPYQVTLRKVRSAIEILKNKFEIHISDLEIANFIKEYKLELLFDHDDDDDALNKNFWGLPLEDRVKILRKNLPYAYYAVVLKYIANNSPLNRITIVVDDIECAEYSEQKDIIKSLLRFRKCLNYTGPIRKKYKVNFIFSCRPATFDALNRDPQINGFNTIRSIQIDRPISLVALLDKRFRAAIDEIGEGRTITGTVEKIDDWKAAYSILQSVTQTLSDKYSDILVGLCNHNIRDALEQLTEILSNSRWFEKIKDHQGSFNIRDENYRTSEAGFLRALALKEQTCFAYFSEAPIANIFYNYEKNQIDLMVAFTCKIFVEKAKNGAGTGIVSLEKSRIKNYLEIPFREEKTADNLEDILNYMVHHHLLRQEVIEHNGEKHTHFIGQPRLYTIWKMIKKSCILLEFFRDTTFLRHANINKYNKGVKIGTSNMKGDDIFLSIIDFIEEIAEWENDAILNVKRSGLSQQYKTHFGSTSLSSLLLCGLQRSVDRFYVSASDKHEIPDNISTSVSKVKSFIGNLNLTLP